MKRNRGKLTALGLGVVLVAGFVWSQRPLVPHLVASSGADAIEVRVVQALESEVPTLDEIPGTVHSASEVWVSARLTGEVRQVLVVAGDTVKRGDALIELDRDLSVAQVAEAEAGLVMANQVLTDATREQKRIEQLLESGARTQREFDRAATATSVAQAQRDAAAEGLAAAKVSLGYARIVAPFDGVIAERLVDPGALTHPGQPLLRLYDPTVLRLEATLSESLLGQVQVGDELALGIDALDSATGTLTGASTGASTGKLEEIDAAVDRVTRSVLLKVSLPQREGILPGMFGRVFIPVGQRSSVTVPEAALVRRGQVEMVFGLSEDGQRARLVVVRSGRVLPDGQVEILSGLSSSALVVSEKAQTLRDGSLLRVVSDANQGEQR